MRFQDPGAQAVRFAAQIKLQRRAEAPITSSMSDCTQGWWERRAGSQTSAVAVALHHCFCSLLPTHRPVRETDKTMINRNHYPSISKLTQPTLPYLQVRGTALGALLRQSVSEPVGQLSGALAVATYQLIFLGAT